MNPHAAELPLGPVLAREHKRAKDLLLSLRAGMADALARFRYSHPRLAVMTDDAIRKAAKYHDALFVVAHEYGFSGWTRFKAHLDALAGKRELRRPFEAELQYYRDRAAGMLSVFGTGERNALRLVRLFHPGFAQSSEADIRAARLTQADARAIPRRASAHWI